MRSWIQRHRWWLVAGLCYVSLFGYTVLQSRIFDYNEWWAHFGQEFFYFFWNAAKLTIAGCQPYDPSTWVGFIYAPQSLLVFYPFGLVSLAVAGYIWTFINLIAVVLMPKLLLVAFGMKHRRRDLFMLLAVIVTFLPMLATIVGGEIKPVLLALLLASFISVRNKRWLLAALSLSIAVWLHVLMGVLFLWYVWKYRSFRFAAYFVLVNVVATAIVVGLVSFDVIINYIRVLLAWSGMLEMSNDTRAMAKLFSPLEPMIGITNVWYLATGVKVILIALLVRGALRDRLGTYAFTAILTVGFLIPSIKWFGHMPLLIPALWLLAAGYSPGSHRAPVVAATAILLMQLSWPLRYWVVRLPETFFVSVERSMFYGITDIIAYLLVIITLVVMSKNIRFREAEA